MWGRWRIAEGSLASSGDPIRVAVVQGNIAQDDKWNPAMRDQIIGRYLSMTQAGGGAGGDVRHLAGIIVPGVFPGRPS